MSRQQRSEVFPSYLIRLRQAMNKHGGTWKAARHSVVFFVEFIALYAEVYSKVNEKLLTNVYRPSTLVDITYLGANIGVCLDIMSTLR